VLEIADGLYILDAYEYDQYYLYDKKTGDRLSWSFPGGDRTITKDIFVGLAGTDLFLHEIGGDTQIIARADGGSEVGQVSTFRYVGLLSETLIIELMYYISRGPDVRRKVLVRISGDWESLGVDLPDETPSADLNKDGKVDSTDLLILQAQWDPK